jgi:hypothetical protein
MIGDASLLHPENIDWSWVCLQPRPDEKYKHPSGWCQKSYEYDQLAFMVSWLPVWRDGHNLQKLKRVDKQSLRTR